MARHVFIGNQIGSLCRHRRHGDGVRRRRPCRKKGFAVTGSDQNVYPPMSTFLADETNRGDERLRGTEPRAQARPRRHRQRHFPRQPGGGVRARSQAALLLAAGAAQGIFHPRQTLHRRRRHARQDHDDFAAGVGVRAQRAESELSHRRHPEQSSARARGSPTANGSSSRATNTTPRFSTSAASSSITSRKSPSSTTSNSITRTFLKIWTRSKKRSRISSGSFRATACCSATATTRTSRRC